MLTRTVKRDNSNQWFEIINTDRSDPVRDACRWLWDHSEGRRSYDRHRRIIGPRAYRSHTLGGRPKEDTHWRRFRHHDALNSRCYDGPPHRPRRSGPVPVWLRRADVVMKTPEFSFHDRRGAPNPRAYTVGTRLDVCLWVGSSYTWAEGHVARSTANLGL